MAATSALARASPFRETEWDRRLDSMLEDLEGAGGGGGGGGSTKLQSYSSGGQQLGQSSMSSSSYRAQQRHQSSFSSTSLASQQRQQQQQQQQSSSFSSRSQFPPAPSNTNGYSVAKSQSNASLHEKADDMLKDLEGSLKASSNYLESRRTVTGPGSREEYHEVRSYSSGGGGRGGGDTDFNLEKQVQHMMPHGDASNMMSSSMKQSYSSYKMSSSQVRSSNRTIQLI